MIGAVRSGVATTSLEVPPQTVARPTIRPVLLHWTIPSATSKTMTTPNGCLLHIEANAGISVWHHVIQGIGCERPLRVIVTVSRLHSTSIEPVMS